jgi:hypothetical protein
MYQLVALPTIDILADPTIIAVLTWAIPLALGIGFLRWGVAKVTGR